MAADPDWAELVTKEDLEIHNLVFSTAAAKAQHLPAFLHVSNSTLLANQGGAYFSVSMITLGSISLLALPTS